MTDAKTSAFREGILEAINTYQASIQKLCTEFGFDAMTVTSFVNCKDLNTKFCVGATLQSKDGTLDKCALGVQKYVAGFRSE